MADWISEDLRAYVVRVGGPELADAPVVIRKPSHTRLIEPRSHPRFDFVVKRFCSRCNNGWMSVIENDAKPILTKMMLGQEAIVEISPENQRRLSAWAYKVALCAEFAHAPDSQKRPIPDDVYTDFYARQIPPESSTAIYCTAYVGRKVHAQTFRNTVSSMIEILGPQQNVTDRTEHYAFTFTITVFRVVFLVIGKIAGEGSPADRFPGPDRIFHRICPPGREALVWPRNLWGLTDDQLFTVGTGEFFGWPISPGHRAPPRIDWS